MYTVGISVVVGALVVEGVVVTEQDVVSSFCEVNEAFVVSIAVVVVRSSEQETATVRKSMIIKTESKNVYFIDT